MRSWREAMAEALYGEHGFYLQAAGPAAHFRTSPQVGTVFVTAVLELLERVDRALEHPVRLDLVDVGAGRGELLTAVAQAAAGRAIAARLHLTGVELAVRPAQLPAQIGWTAQIPRLSGLLLANEWLDVVPVDVVQLSEDGPRTVLVDPSGRDELAGTPTAADLAWLQRWWPLSQPGDRAEIGSTRDAAWTHAVSRVCRGLAVAVDYGHTAATRPPYGSLVGYRSGAAVTPVPDGSCDLTAHVALDSCLAATGGLRTEQRTALAELGVSAARPPRKLAAGDPMAYLEALRRAGEAAELLDPTGLGGFGWLLHGVSMAVPLNVAGQLGSDSPAVRPDERS